MFERDWNNYGDMHIAGDLPTDVEGMFDNGAALWAATRIEDEPDEDDYLDLMDLPRGNMAEYERPAFDNVPAGQRLNKFDMDYSEYYHTM